MNFNIETQKYHKGFKKPESQNQASEKE